MESPKTKPQRPRERERTERTKKSPSTVFYREFGINQRLVFQNNTILVKTQNLNTKKETDKWERREEEERERGEGRKRNRKKIVVWLLLLWCLFGFLAEKRRRSLLLSMALLTRFSTVDWWLVQCDIPNDMFFVFVSKTHVVLMRVHACVNI